MTLGEKIRRARKNCGLSQEQLADKLAVSRSAVAKWETDKGLPDVGNLKILARLLGVSVDYLLDEAESAEKTVIREFYSLAACIPGCKRVKKDHLVRNKFRDAKVYPLYAQQDRDTSAFQPTDQMFYLVEKEEKRLLVTVTDTCIEIRRLEQNCDEFQLDGRQFIKSNYELTV